MKRRVAFGIFSTILTLGAPSFAGPGYGPYEWFVDCYEDLGGTSDFQRGSTYDYHVSTFLGDRREDFAVLPGDRNGAKGFYVIYENRAYWQEASDSSGKFVFQYARKKGEKPDNLFYVDWANWTRDPAKAIPVYSGSNLSDAKVYKPVVIDSQVGTVSDGELKTYLQSMFDKKLESMKAKFSKASADYQTVKNEIVAENPRDTYDAAIVACGHHVHDDLMAFNNLGFSEPALIEKLRGVQQTINGTGGGAGQPAQSVGHN